MDPMYARRKAEELADRGAFISLSDDPGSGTLVAVKDNVDVAGMVTTAGGTHFPKVPARNDAPIVAALKDAGCHVVGKANLHEYAFGVTNENPHYGVARNPVDQNRVAGGSSGGSALAVALGLCDWAVGSDTGGSIRIPAGLCGVVGMKPTMGLLSSDGIFPLAETMDTPGPIAPDVATTGRALEMLGGGTAGSGAPDGWQPSLAVPSDWEYGLDEPTQDAWRNAAGDLPRIDFPALKELEDVFQPILFAEASSYHLEWLRERPDEYGPDVRKTLELGFKVTGAGYLWACRQRDRLRADVERAIGSHDALLIPNTAIVAPPVRQPHVREKLLRFTRPFSLSGHPVVTLPLPVRGLPVGVQVVGHHGRDADLLRVAAALEARWGTGGTAR